MHYASQKRWSFTYRNSLVLILSCCITVHDYNNTGTLRACWMDNHWVNIQFEFCNVTTHRKSIQEYCTLNRLLWEALHVHTNYYNSKGLEHLQSLNYNTAHDSHAITKQVCCTILPPFSYLIRTMHCAPSTPKSKQGKTIACRTFKTQKRCKCSSIATGQKHPRIVLGAAWAMSVRVAAIPPLQALRILSREDCARTIYTERKNRQVPSSEHKRVNGHAKMMSGVWVELPSKCRTSARAPGWSWAQWAALGALGRAVTLLRPRQTQDSHIQVVCATRLEVGHWDPRCTTIAFNKQSFFPVYNIITSFFIPCVQIRCVILYTYLSVMENRQKDALLLCCKVLPIMI